jgi:hypothetical protein
MCTVSFVPNGNGFYLGMNRDESRLRTAACPPEIHGTAGDFSIYPSEPGSGTWIGINASGLCLALINWHQVPRRAVDPVVSRGIVVRELISARTTEDLPGLLGDLPLKAMPPFRMISFSLRESLVREFRWDQNRVIAVSHDWRAKHWFSSGLDEPSVERVRSNVCQEAWREPDAGELGWLRRLHRSHLPNRGGFSICMHRDDANTVSYTEITFSNGDGTMRYHPGPLCRAVDGQFFEKTFPLVTPQNGPKSLDNV